MEDPIISTNSNPSGNGGNGQVGYIIGISLNTYYFAGGGGGWPNGGDCGTVSHGSSAGQSYPNGGSLSVGDYYITAGGIGSGNASLDGYVTITIA